MMNTLRNLSPVAWSVVAALWMVAFFCGLGLSLTGSYLLTEHAIHTAEQNSMRNAVAECRALESLDHAGNGITFPRANASHPSEEALVRLFSGIHGVVIHSGCAKVLPESKP